MFYDCKDCVFATNSRKQARIHIEEVGHDVAVELEEEDN